MDPWYYNRLPAQHVAGEIGWLPFEKARMAGMIVLSSRFVLVVSFLTSLCLTLCTRFLSGSGASSGEAVTSASSSSSGVLQPTATYGSVAAAGNSFLLAQQLRDAAALTHEAAQYQNMALPPGLVQAAKPAVVQQQPVQQVHQSTPMQLQQRVSTGEHFLTPPQTPVSAWKNTANLNLVVPEPHRPASRQFDVNGGGAGSPAPVSVAVGNGRGGNVRQLSLQAVELKRSQPIFPGQPPPLARVEKAPASSFVAAAAAVAQPPPRQSSQVRRRSH